MTLRNSCARGKPPQRSSSARGLREALRRAHQSSGRVILLVREAPTNFVSGDRYASIRDPFGVRWSVMSRVEDRSEEESARRVADWAASMNE